MNRCAAERTAEVSGKAGSPNMLRLRLVVPLVVFALTAMAAVLPSVTSAADGSVGVSIHEGADATTWGYTPTSTTIAAGQTVTWTNSGAFAHEAASTDGSWKTPLLNQGASASVSFSTPGTYAYICTPHPWMQGTIVVTPAVSAAAPVAAPADAPAADAPSPANAPSPNNPATPQPADNTTPDSNPDAGN